VARRREIAAALAALRGRVGEHGAGALTLDAPAVPVDAIFDVGLAGARHMFDEASGAAEAGVGSAIRVDAQGKSRFDELRARGEAALRAIEEARLGAEHAPGPRLVGGFSFFTGDAARARAMGDPFARWSGFADASFVLPRVTLGSAHGRGYLRVVASRAELADEDALAARVDGLLDALAEASPDRTSHRAPAIGLLDDASGESFEALVAEALTAIAARALVKVVAARACRVTAKEPLDPIHVVARLAERERPGVRFALERDGVVFLGATPERLVAIEGGLVRTEALAGSLPRRADERDGEAEARALLASDKDRREHALVVEAIVEALSPFVRPPRVAETPEVRTLRHVRHLATPIEAELARDTHILELVARLHPTPALGGVPREAALAFIAVHEAAPRGWYASPVGWFDARGEGSFAVAIRSGLLAGSEALLYAGAGIVEGSEPRAERLETRAKLGPLLSALGIA
jgi:isochorismate synthase